MTINTDRPSVLQSDIYRMRVEQVNWLVIVSLLNGNPFDLFTIVDNLTVEIQINTGNVKITNVENSQQQFDFEYINSKGKQINIANISQNSNREFNNYCILISSLLQDNKPISYIISTLDKLEPDNEGFLNSWMSGVKRVLRKYIQDGEINAQEKCPVCGNNKMIYKEGCLMCNNCGYSKCG